MCETIPILEGKPENRTPTSQYGRFSNVIQTRFTYQRQVNCVVEVFDRTTCKYTGTTMSG